MGALIKAILKGSCKPVKTRKKCGGCEVYAVEMLKGFPAHRSGKN